MKKILHQIIMAVALSSIVQTHGVLAHHTNKNVKKAVPAAKKLTPKKLAATKKSTTGTVEKTVILQKNIKVKPVDITPQQIEKPIKKAVNKSIATKSPASATPKTVNTTPKKVASESLVAKNLASENLAPKNTIVTETHSTVTHTNDKSLIESKKAQGALIGSVVLGAASASPVGLVLGGLSGYMVGKGEEAKMENEKREIKKKHAIKPAPLQANYQACKKMTQSQSRNNLPFCFYSME